MTNSLTLAKKGAPIPFIACVIAEYVSQAKSLDIQILWLPSNNLGSTKDKINAILNFENESIQGENESINKLLSLVAGSISQEVKEWVDFALFLNSANFVALSAAFDKLEDHLVYKSYLSGYSITIADLIVWGALRQSAIFQKNLKSNAFDSKPNLSRWYSHILTHTAAENTAASFASAVAEKSKDQGSFDLGLKNLVYGKVCTRFPPEPSGYLHIGHAKAALLNQHIAKSNGGELIVRFDDTNPSKEKSEFENSITEDLRLLGIQADRVTHTSDYFGELQEYVVKLISAGDAYVDDTDQATMREQRMVGEASKCRDLSIEENLRRFGEIVLGSEEGQKLCVRAKISVDNKNKAMRDPVIYRVNLTPHHRTGTVYRAYPLYDFACPIVDSLEGVTHALRSNEYRDRNPLYYWFTEKLGMRAPQITDFSRMNFVYTLLSKRKLQWFVDEKLVTGWDDARFPTVRGIRRRGLTIEALKQYILMQGASQNQIMLEWDKLWSMNKKIIDPISPRYTAIESNNSVLASVVGDGVPASPELRAILKHKKVPELGSKNVCYSSLIQIEQADAAEFAQGEELTLMDWGNAFVENIEHSTTESGETVVSALTLRLNLGGNVKSTKKKVTWLSKDVNTSNFIATLFDFDYLINKKKLEDADNISDYLTETTQFETQTFIDEELYSAAPGTIVQLERKGFYIVDKASNQTEDRDLHLFYIPDGKVSNLASKANVAISEGKAKLKTKPKADSSSPWGKGATPKPTATKVDKSSDGSATSHNGSFGLDPSNLSTMYQVPMVYKDPSIVAEEVSSMYSVQRII